MKVLQSPSFPPRTLHSVHALSASGYEVLFLI
ncbi:hypothetical protein TFLX_00566 [Thermoflexales bacterium]|nr:hypothetical protein TFLX_00566 [Thermoflexales bacterium]